MKISASIYSRKNGNLREIINELDSLPIDFIHIDCNDNPKVFDDIVEIRHHTQKPIDLHIISAKPEAYFDLLLQHQPEYITFQYEPIGRFIEMPAEVSSQKGIAITTETDLDVFDEFASSFHFIMFMATTPGYSKGEFRKNNFQRIRTFKKQYPATYIHVDGGVNGEVSFILRNIGVDAAVSGSFLMSAHQKSSALLDLKINTVHSTYKIKDFMIPSNEIDTISPETFSFPAILESVDKNKLGFTVYIDNKGHLKGFIANADIRKGLLKNLDDLNKTKAEEVINFNPAVAFEDMTIRDLIQFIKVQKFPVNYLPVIDRKGKFKGALTFENLIKGE
ncbi:MAG: CBS domain-containing protein [Bacteroidetes bacterium]|nr:CBS domain-containing protein [Bacteroidota bacterium]MBL6962261.1 CBS domain-containing protein [Bacteroidota bacterium]